MNYVLYSLFSLSKRSRARNGAALGAQRGRVARRPLPEGPGGSKNARAAPKRVRACSWGALVRSCAVGGGGVVVVDDKSMTKTEARMATGVGKTRAA